MSSRVLVQVRVQVLLAVPQTVVSSVPSTTALCWAVELDLTPPTGAVERCPTAETGSGHCVRHLPWGESPLGNAPKVKPPNRWTGQGVSGSCRSHAGPCLTESSDGGCFCPPLSPALWVGRFKVLANTGIPPAPSVPAAVGSTVPPCLSPLESLCFEQVSFWVGVVARNRGSSGRLASGRPWTRLPAKDLAANLEERLPFLSVTVRQVRKALGRLVELGLVVREQFWQSERGRSDYWYSLAEVPTPEPAVGAQSEGVPACAPQGTPGVTVGEPRSDQTGHPFLRTLSACLSEKTRQTEVRTENRQPRAPHVDREGAASVPLAPVPLCAGEPVPPSTQGACAPSTDPVPLSTGTVPLPSASGAVGRHGSVWDRINALVALFDPASVDPVSPRAVVVGNRTLHVSDGACAPLR